MTAKRKRDEKGHFIPPSVQSSDSSGEAEAPPPLAHDPAAHEAAGRPNGAVRGCPACDDNVVSGLAAYARPGDRGGMMLARSGRESGDGPRISSGPERESGRSAAAYPVEILEGKDDVLAAVLAAAEKIAPGLAETLAPVVQYGLEQMAVQGAEDQAFKRWQAGIERELADIKGGMEALHNNIAHIYNLLIGAVPMPPHAKPPIRAVK